jgi:hypothetical protein
MTVEHFMGVDVMDCVNHPGTPAQGTCVYCGKFYCADCLVEVDGRLVCRNDVTRMFQDAGRINNTRESYIPPVEVNIANDNLNQNINTVGTGYIRRSRMVALVLCLFFGWLGFHRFYVGKTGTGLIWLCTGGMFVVGWAFDFLTILFGGFTDKAGQPLA